MVHIDIGEGLKLPFPSAGKVGALFSPLKGASFLPLPISFSLLPPQPLPLGPVAGQATVKALRELLLPPGWECTWSALWTIEYCYICLFASPPPPPTLKHLLVALARLCQIISHDVHCTSFSDAFPQTPKLQRWRGENDKSLDSTGPTTPAATMPNSLSIQDKSRKILFS